MKRSRVAEALIVSGTVALASPAGLATATGASALDVESANPHALAQPLMVASCSACNPCASACNPCNPCANACNPCNPCAASACNPCNPCAVNPCNPCASD